ncbi:MAG TPA: MMPL family transporter [Planctomycetota bacterium]|nr:MMPL family transporter [Planctomycetota bacterium]
MRFLPVLIAFLVCLAPLPLVLGLKSATGNDAWIDTAGPAWRDLTLVAERFGRDDGFVIGVFAGDVLTPPVLTWQAGFEQELSALPGISRRTSLLTAQDVRVDDLGPAPIPLLPAGGVLNDDDRARVLDHPLYSGLLVARTGRASGILIEVAPGMDQDALAVLAQRVRSLLHDQPPPNGVHALLGGLPIQKQAINDAVLADQRLTVPLSMAIHTLLLLILLRRPLLMAVPLLALAGSLAWTYAAIAMVGRPLDAILGLLPPLVMGVAVAVALHLVYGYAAQVAAAAARPLAATLRQVTVPLIIATLTTAISVGGLWWGPVEGVRRFAPFAAIGVVLGALAPFLWLWALRPFISTAACLQLHQGFTGVRIGQAMGRIAATCLRHRVVVLLAYIGLVGLSAWLLTRVRSDADFLAALPDRDPVKIAHERIDADLTGILTLEVLIDLGHPVSDADLPALREATTAVRADPTVAYGCSLATVADLVASRLHAAKQPASDNLLADLRLGAKPAWQRFVARGLTGGNDHVVRIMARQHDTRVSINTGAALRLRDAVGTKIPGATVTVASPSLLLSETTERLLPSVALTLGLALPLIAVLLFIVLRSPRLGVTALVLAGLPLVFTYASLPVLGWSLDIGVAMIACIALGIIMDDSIHLTCAVARQTCDGDLGGAATIAVGPVLFGATLAMSASFLACLFGQFAYTRHFGALLATVFLIGLVVNLTLAPALLAGFRRRS